MPSWLDDSIRKKKESERLGKELDKIEANFKKYGNQLGKKWDPIIRNLLNDIAKEAWGEFLFVKKYKIESKSRQPSRRPFGKHHFRWRAVHRFDTLRIRQFIVVLLCKKRDFDFTEEGLKALQPITDADFCFDLPQFKIFDIEANLPSLQEALKEAFENIEIFGIDSEDHFSYPNRWDHGFFPRY